MSNSIIKKTSSCLSHDHIFTGYAGSAPYLYNKTDGVIDGIGRQHINLYCKCDICDEEIFVAKMHVQADGKIYGITSKNQTENGHMD